MDALHGQQSLWQRNFWVLRPTLARLNNIVQGQVMILGLGLTDGAGTRALAALGGADIEDCLHAISLFYGRKKVNPTKVLDLKR